MELTYDPVTETYFDVENLIYHVCNLFQEKHGGDHDDMVSLSHLVFVDCYRTWRPGKAPFSSYLSTCVWRRLLEEKRKSLRLGYSLSLDYTNEFDKKIDVEDSHREFDFAEFADALRKDAQYVLNLVLKTPEEIQQVADKKGGQIRNLKSTIREHLYAIGWGALRIKDAFEEISQCL